MASNTKQLPGPTERTWKSIPYITAIHLIDQCHLRIVQALAREWFENSHFPILTSTQIVTEKQKINKKFSVNISISFRFICEFWRSKNVTGKKILGKRSKKNKDSIFKENIQKTTRNRRRWFLKSKKGRHLRKPNWSEIQHMQRTDTILQIIPAETDAKNYRLHARGPVFAHRIRSSLRARSVYSPARIHILQ